MKRHGLSGHDLAMHIYITCEPSATPATHRVFEGDLYASGATVIQPMWVERSDTHHDSAQV